METYGSVNIKMQTVINIICALCITCASCSPPLARTAKTYNAGYSAQNGAPEDNFVSSSNIKDRRMSIIKIAMSQIGVPYKPGGADPRGFDCSGFSSYVYKRNKIMIVRTATGQYRNGKKLKGKTVRPGDLVFFKIDGKSIGHVGIYLGKGKFIHAPSSGKSVEVQSLSSEYWKPRFLGAATYL
jgi:cell wall-associated NlpC family hydrolase